MERKVKVEILDMKYDTTNNLFQMKVKELEKGDEIVFAIRGTDFGITPDVPIEIINNFCQDMKGKEKNLFIEIDRSSIKDAERDKDNKVNQEDINNITSKIDDYPVREVFDQEVRRRYGYRREDEN